MDPSKASSQTTQKAVKLRYRVEYSLVMAVFFASKILPEGLLRWGLRFFAGAFYRLSRRRRQLTLDNLALAFPDWNDVQREKVARAAYRHIGMVIGDCLLVVSGRWNLDTVAKRADLTAVARIRDQGTSGRGLVMVSAHLGNWEFMSLLTALAAGRKGMIITRYLTNPLLEERLIKPFRSSTGVQVVYKHNGLLSGSRMLRNGGVFGVLIDQKTGERDGVPAIFLGQEVIAVASAAQLQLRFAADALAVFLVRSPTGELLLEVSDPICVDDPKAEGALELLVQRQQDAVENMIRKYPEQWFWMHDRFRLGSHRSRTARRELAGEQAAAVEKDAIAPSSRGA